MILSRHWRKNGSLPTSRASARCWTRVPNGLVEAAILVDVQTRVRIPPARAAASILALVPEFGLLGLTNTAIVEALGINSRTQVQLILHPVRRVQAHARKVAARPVEVVDKTSGNRSPPISNTIGMLERRPLGGERRSRVAGRRDHVDRPADQVGGQPRQQVILNSAQRYSIAMFWRSTKPTSPRPWRNAAKRWSVGSGLVLLRNPMTGMTGRCARAASGQTVCRTAQK